MIIEEQAMPHDITNEKCVLGAIILDNQSIYDVIGTLSPNDFYVEAHAKLYDLMTRWIPDSQVVDLVTLKGRLGDKIDDFGGLTYLANLIDVVPNAARINGYAKIVKDRSERRKLIKAAHDAMRSAYDRDNNVYGVIDALETELSLIGSKKGDTLRTAAQLAEEQIERYDKIRSGENHTTGIPTGLYQLDELTAGIQKTDLIVVAARPKCGKTALATTITTNVMDKFKVAIFSIEQARHQLINRMVSRRARLDMFALHSGRLPQADWKTAYSKVMELGGKTFWIDDSPATLNHIRSVTKKLKINNGLDLVIVDYLQLVRHIPARGIRMEKRQLIGEVTGGLKAMAKELNVAVLCLSQLNREVTEFEEPTLANLRESGEIEQDADVVWFLYKKIIKPKEQGQKAETHDMLSVAKHRNGPEGKIRVNFLKQFTSFENLYEDQHEE